MLLLLQLLWTSHLVCRKRTMVFESDGCKKSHFSHVSLSLIWLPCFVSHFRMAEGFLSPHQNIVGGSVDWKGFCLGSVGTFAPYRYICLQNKLMCPSKSGPCFLSYRQADISDSALPQFMCDLKLFSPKSGKTPLVLSGVDWAKLQVSLIELAVNNLQ